MPILNAPAPEPTTPIERAPAPVRATVGGGTIGATNYATFELFDGPAVPALGGGLFMAFQTVKHIPWFDQRKYAHIALLVLGIAISLAIAIFISKTDVEQAIYRGCATGLQAWFDWLGLKAGGFPGLPAAATGDKSGAAEVLSDLVLPESVATQPGG